MANLDSRCKYNNVLLFGAFGFDLVNDLNRWSYGDGY